MLRDRNQTIVRRVNAYPAFDEDNSDDMAPVNRRWPAPRPVPHERRAIRSTLANIWSRPREHGRTIVYQAGQERFCLRLVRCGLPPKRASTSPPAHCQLSPRTALFARSRLLSLSRFRTTLALNPIHHCFSSFFSPVFPCCRKESPSFLPNP